MNLNKMMDLLNDGQLFIKSDDLASYSDKNGNEIVIDNRMIIKNGLHVVKPIGVDIQGYVYYVCYDCGQVHSIHKSSVGTGKLIMAGCCKARSHAFRVHINQEGKLIKVKRDKFYLDLSDFKILGGNENV